MKGQLLLSMLALTGTLAAGAYAQADSTFTLGAVVAATVCTTTNGATSCQVTGTPVEQNVSINVTNCATDSSGTVTCSGSWNTTVVSGNTTYAAVISVSSSTPNGGALSYSVTYAVGTSSTNLNIGVVMPATTSLTDTAMILGPNFASAGSAPTNSAILAIGPAAAGLAAKAKTFSAVHGLL